MKTIKDITADFDNIIINKNVFFTYDYTSVYIEVNDEVITEISWDWGPENENLKIKYVSIKLKNCNLDNNLIKNIVNYFSKSEISIFQSNKLNKYIIDDINIKILGSIVCYTNENMLNIHKNPDNIFHKYALFIDNNICNRIIYKIDDTYMIAYEENSTVIHKPYTDSFDDFIHLNFKLYKNKSARK